MKNEKINRPFNFFSDYIPYYRQLRPITDSALASILVSRLEFWFEREPSSFYKFFEPCPGHELYKDGDSWMEELSFSLAEFNGAFEKVGVSYNSKNEYMKSENKFKKTITLPKYSIEKKFDPKKNKKIVIKKVSGIETQEVEMYYCRYHDRMQNVTYYFKNPNKSILTDAEALVDRTSRFTVKGKSRFTVNRKSRSRYNGKADLGKSGKPISYINKVSGEDSGEDQEKTTAPQNGTTNGDPSGQKNQKRVPAKYAAEWEMWKAERGETTFESVFGEKPIFNGKDFSAFCQLRDAGKTVAEISDRYLVFCRTENSWYAEKGYAFHVFADNFNSGNAKMKRIKENGKNGKSEPKVTAAPTQAYYKPEQRKQLTPEEKAAEDEMIQKKLAQMRQDLLEKESVNAG